MAPHFHAVDSSLSPDDAAQCVYTTEREAKDMVNVFLSLASSLAHAEIRQVGEDDYLVNERGATNRVAVEKCWKTDCPPVQSLNRERKTTVTSRRIRR